MTGIEDLVERYRVLPAERRRAIAAQASPALRARLAAVERDIALRHSPGSLAALLTDGREMQAAHLDLIDDAFRRIAAGETVRLLLTMPPRHGKSRRAARWAPLWYLLQRPDHRVMIASYSADLADDHGRWIRDAITTWGEQLGVTLHPGSKAANRFDIAGREGGLFAAGVGGGLTGKGANLAIIDDPIKDAADAQSPTMRRRLWEWWQAVLLTRVEPGGSVIVIQTRWDEDDLAGRILAGETASDWTIIDLPAIADSPDDALGRKVGEPLWPARYGKKALAGIRRAVGERVWASLFQQRPRPVEGGVWRRAWIDTARITAVEFSGVELARVVVAVDPSGGESSVNDETGIVGLGLDYHDHLYVVADESGTLGANDWGLTACRLALRLRADAIVVEANYGGNMARQILAQAWDQLAREGETLGQLMPLIVEVNAKVGKRLRAEPVAQLYEQGRVHHVGHYPELEGQMVTWVAGMDSPDRMDAAVHGMTELAGAGQLDALAQGMDDSRLLGRR
ncbi:terminase large subunit domain-containing protein [Kitasatospora brasiliensis]|uniref:terminase large subunit domain-containing protein n=1 Tax=Kitasatospora brasiliensis TaxID=3058040 RepID=UPI002930DFF1|nr:terminase family protein [Kitasatospora sp. K002]